MTIDEIRADILANLKAAENNFATAASELDRLRAELEQAAE